MKLLHELRRNPVPHRMRLRKTVDQQQGRAGAADAGEDLHAKSSLSIRVCAGEACSCDKVTPASPATPARASRCHGSRNHSVDTVHRRMSALAGLLHRGPARGDVQPRPPLATIMPFLSAVPAWKISTPSMAEAPRGRGSRCPFRHRPDSPWRTSPRSRQRRPTSARSSCRASRHSRRAAG